ncbi:hypothetical protein AQUCO_00400694v1 [Aquilegia coerulea]|uniref:Sulfotransferase n=1 Tax=Aquilegia coerulea TaxID=218851 RepID=A0A2G5EW44_AQUCA|nr:hypothetical protein AQUCO_00400694v1 [Aquilegia coerulea]
MDSLKHVEANLLSEVVSAAKNEFHDLLESLPSEIGSTSDLLYLYNGFWYAPEDLEGILAAQQHFQAQDTDIILVTTPKSGTTWLKSLVFSITNRKQYTVSDQIHPLLTTNPHGIVPFIEQIYYDNTNPDVSHIPSPRLFATHVSYTMLPESIKTTKCRIIYLCRNPKDIFVSMRHFGAKIISPTNPACQLIPVEEAFNKFCRGVTWFGPFWEQALEYCELSLENPDKVLFLKYEDLKGDIISQLKKIAVHLGCPFSLKEETEGVIDGIARMCSFEHLSNLEVNKVTGVRSLWMVDNKDFFRKGEVGDWKNHLTDSMVEQIDQVVEQKLHCSGLTFK